MMEASVQLAEATLGWGGRDEQERWELFFDTCFADQCYHLWITGEGGQAQNQRLSTGSPATDVVQRQTHLFSSLQPVVWPCPTS